MTMAKNIVAVVVAVLISVLALPALAGILGTVRPAGQVWVAQGGQDGTAWSPLERTRPLLSGDRLRTGAGAFVLADLGGQGSLALAPESRLVVSATRDRTQPRLQLALEEGLVAFSTPRAGGLILSAGGSSMTVSEAGTRGALVSDGQLALVRVDEGALLVRTGGEPLRLEAGGQMLLAAGSAAKAAAAEASGVGAVEGMASWLQARLGGLQWSSMAIMAAVATGVVVAVDDDPASPSQ